MQKETKVNIWQCVRVEVDSLRKVIKQIHDSSSFDLAQSACEDLSVAFLYNILSNNSSMHLGALTIDNILTKYEIINTKIKNELFDSSIIIKDAISNIIINNSDKNLENIKKEFENIKKFQDRCSAGIKNEDLSRKIHPIKDEDRFHYFQPAIYHSEKYWFMNQLDEKKLKVTLEYKKYDVSERNNLEYEKIIQTNKDKLKDSFTNREKDSLENKFDFAVEEFKIIEKAFEVYDNEKINLCDKLGKIKNGNFENELNRTIFPFAALEIFTQYSNFKLIYKKYQDHEDLQAALTGFMRNGIVSSAQPDSKLESSASILNELASVLRDKMKESYHFTQEQLNALLGIAIKNTYEALRKIQYRSRFSNFVGSTWKTPADKSKFIEEYNKTKILTIILIDKGARMKSDKVKLAISELKILYEDEKDEIEKFYTKKQNLSTDFIIHELINHIKFENYNFIDTSFFKDFIKSMSPDEEEKKFLRGLTNEEHNIYKEIVEKIEECETWSKIRKSNWTGTEQGLEINLKTSDSWSLRSIKRFFANAITITTKVSSLSLGLLQGIALIGVNFDQYDKKLLVYKQKLEFFKDIRNLENFLINMDELDESSILGNDGIRNFILQKIQRLAEIRKKLELAEDDAQRKIFTEELHGYVGSSSNVVSQIEKELNENNEDDEHKLKHKTKNIDLLGSRKKKADINQFNLSPNPSLELLEHYHKVKYEQEVIRFMQKLTNNILTDNQMKKVRRNEDLECSQEYSKILIANANKSSLSDDEINTLIAKDDYLNIVERKNIVKLFIKEKYLNTKLQIDNEVPVKQHVKQQPKPDNIRRDNDSQKSSVVKRTSNSNTAESSRMIRINNVTNRQNSNATYSDQKAENSGLLVQKKLESDIKAVPNKIVTTEIDPLLIKNHRNV